jgi:hypothetical protein
MYRVTYQLPPADLRASRVALAQLRGALNNGAARALHGWLAAAAEVAARHAAAAAAGEGLQDVADGPSSSSATGSAASRGSGSRNTRAATGSGDGQEGGDESRAQGIDAALGSDASTWLGPLLAV